MKQVNPGNTQIKNVDVNLKLDDPSGIDVMLNFCSKLAEGNLKPEDPGGTTV